MTVNKIMKVALHCLSLILMFGAGLGLENGLARTPPMGWLAWERFRCNIDCKNDPDNCISEDLFKAQADRMAEDGYLKAGYEYLILDDCWMSLERDENQRLQGDLERFPSGIKALSDYTHKAGLKFGIYEDYGTHTCAGYPGIVGHMEVDAQTFADWEVDYVKLDGCYAEPKDMDQGYPEFGRHLLATGRPMVYSCSWPFYQTLDGMTPNFTLIIEHCNLWRNWYDIQDSWGSVSSIIDYFAEVQDDIAPNAGPGHWNDPDMLVMGNFGLSYEESKAQMGIWAILAAPLIMSVDLRTIKPDIADIYKNKGYIAINQDPLGIQGRRLTDKDHLETWARPISPAYDGKYSYAIALFNRRTDGIPREMSVVINDLGMNSESGYKCQDAFDGTDFGLFNGGDTLSAYVNPSGIVVIRCELQQPSSVPDAHLPVQHRITDLHTRENVPRMATHGSLRKVGNFYVRDFVKTN